MWIVSIISSSSTYLRYSTIQSDHRCRHRRRDGSNLNTTTQSLPFPVTKNSTIRITNNNDDNNNNMAIYSGDANGLPPLPPPPDTPGTLWIAGVLFSAILSIWRTKNYWGPILMFKEKVGKVVDVVEDVAEMVETAAEGVDKVAEEIAEYLPEGSKLQKAVLFVENAAEKIAKDADLTGDIIDKIEAAGDELSSFIKQNRESKEEE